MLDWQGFVLAAISMVLAALAGRGLRKLYMRRQARKRLANREPMSRQVRRAEERKQRR